MDAAVCLAPIALLIVLMTKKNGVPSHVALPSVALLVYAIQLLYFASDPNLINATVVEGLLSAWTPILIIWGAVFLFKTMECSGGMDVVRSWLNGLSDNRVAQLMIIGWAFSFMIEGASGFGTPAALAAPLLVGLGFAPLKVAVLALVMNSVPVSFGAVGTPTWFGMGQLGLQEDELLRIGWNTALIHAVAATVIPLIALRFVVSWQDVRGNLLFIYLSIAACVVPYLLLAAVNYEFPALVGGAIGLVLTIALAKWQLGLAPTGGTRVEPPAVHRAALVKATFPLWATVLILFVTRVPQFGLRAVLTDRTPLIQASLGSFAELTISRVLVVSLENIFGAGIRWAFEVLYIPALIPFFLVSFITFALYRLKPREIGGLFVQSYRRMARPIVALMGALVMVKLLMVGGDRSMVLVIGNFFAGIAGDHWQYAAAYMGALGAFFSGSATISNLTFGGIQDSIAASLNLDRTVILSLQSVGAAMGNMVSINNIVAVCSILGIANREGEVLKKTVFPMLLYGIIAAVVGIWL